MNALSNFVADAERVVGFDPFARLADYLEARAYGAAAGDVRESAEAGREAVAAAGVA